MADALAVGALVGERYRLVEAVADRGMGETWRVRDARRGDATLSMKFLRPVAGDEIPAQALGAIRALKALRHDAVPAVLNHGLYGGRPWVVFDDVVGESVGALLDRARDAEVLVDQALVRRVFDAVAGALRAAHAAPLPLTHGTLSPGSVIVLSKPSPRSPCALLDLGLMPWVDAPFDAPARSARTLVTRAPEVMSGGDAIVATDVFALGALLTEMLALPAPMGATLVAVTAERRRHDVPAGVWRALSRAMSPAPGARFPDVASLAAALDAAWREPLPQPRSLAAALSAAPRSLFDTVAPADHGPSLTPSSTPRPAPPAPPTPPATRAPMSLADFMQSMSPVAEPKEPNPWSTNVLSKEVAVPGAPSDLDQTLVKVEPRAPRRDDMTAVMQGPLGDLSDPLEQTLVAGGRPAVSAPVPAPVPAPTLVAMPSLAAPAAPPSESAAPVWKSPAAIAGFLLAVVAVGYATFWLTSH